MPYFITASGIWCGVSVDCPGLCVVLCAGLPIKLQQITLACAQSKQVFDLLFRDALTPTLEMRDKELLA